MSVVAKRKLAKVQKRRKKYCSKIKVFSEERKNMMHGASSILGQYAVCISIM